MRQDAGSIKGGEQAYKAIQVAAARCAIPVPRTQHGPAGAMRRSGVFPG